MNTTIKGTLEINHRKGTISFQNEDSATILRISKLPKPLPRIHETTEIDIVHMFGVIYRIA